PLDCMHTARAPCPDGRGQTSVLAAPAKILSCSPRRRAASVQPCRPEGAMGREARLLGGWWGILSPVLLFRALTLIGVLLGFGACGGGEAERVDSGRAGLITGTGHCRTASLQVDPSTPAQPWAH